MASFDKAFDLLMQLEFNKPANYLHKNRGENDYTVAGIYKTAHPHWVGWAIVASELHANNHNIELTSSRLYHNKVFKGLVAVFYQEHFWLKMKLNKINSDKIADEMFIFGVNAGTRNAIRKAQKIVGVETDGLIGPMTINALNAYDENRFDFVFDFLEEQFYDDLIAKKPSFAIFKDGWHNRAKAV